jgi:leucyl aminopeptidase
MMQARLVDSAAEKVPADALILPLLEGQKTLPAEAARLNRKLGGAIEEVLQSRQFRGRFMEQLPVHNLSKIPSRSTLLVGLGQSTELDLVRLRNTLQSAGRWLRKHGARKVAVLVTSDVARLGSPAELARAISEALVLSNFEARAFRTRSREGEEGQLTNLSLIGLNGAKSAGAGVSEGLALANATNLVREWVNTPANAFTPTIFVQKVREAIKGSGLKLKVLEVAEMRRLKMGALLAVARGSDEPAKMIVLRYRGGTKAGPTLGLVGKGITFDSGGISIKPSDHMEMMKSDMGGGAAVVGAMLAIAELKPAINVIGVVPATENMPSGHATKPGDVVTASNGKTIEIINTDAEGRLILADGITYAINQGATHLIDVATLTGSIMRSLGPVATGAFTNHAKLMDLVNRAAELAGERVWQMPTWPEYDDLIVSNIADIKNSTVPWAGATTAALFIREFVGGRPWVHLDIAGSAWQEASEMRAIPKGPTGAGVRLMAHLARLLAQN